MLRAEKADHLPLLLELLAYAQTSKFVQKTVGVEDGTSSTAVAGEAEVELVEEGEGEEEGAGAGEGEGKGEEEEDEEEDEEGGESAAPAGPVSASEAEWRAVQVSAAADAFTAPGGPIDTVKLATFYGCAQVSEHPPLSLFSRTPSRAPG